MWLNDKEEKIFGPFVKFVYDNENSNFRFVYVDGLDINVSLHLYEFESDNGLDNKDKDYEEFWEMAFEIIQINCDNANKHSVGDKILVNYHNVPSSYTVIK